VAATEAAVATKGAGATETAVATTATEEAVAEAAAQQEQRCHGGGGGGRRWGRGKGNNSSGGGNRVSGGNKGSGGREQQQQQWIEIISYVASYGGPIQTGFLRGLRKSSGGTGIVIPVKKVPQEWKTQESGGFLQELPT
jgi:hypothetical protein